MTRTSIPATNWAPTRTSTAIALLGTAGGVWGLSTAVGIRKGVVATALGAVCLAIALWLLTFERWRVPATLGGSLLLVPAGAGVASGVGYELLVAFAASFPAVSQTGVIAQILRIVGVMAVLWGCTLATFGAVASIRGVATTATLSRSFGLVNRVALLPLVFFFVLSGRALLSNFDLGAQSLVGELVSSVTDWLFAPVSNQLHLAGFWLLFALASYGTYRAVRDLPIQELAGETSMRDVRLADLVGYLQWTLGALAVLGLLGFLPALLVQFVVPESAIWRSLPEPVYGFLVKTTSSGDLRTLLAWATLVGGALAGVASLVRRSSRTSTQDMLVGYAPFVAGMAVVAGVGVGHRQVLQRLVDFVAGRLTEPLTGTFLDMSGRVIEFYGSETIVMGFTVAVLVLAAGAIFVLYLSFAFGYVSDRVSGPALAGAGLFLGAAFAATLNTTLWLVLGGLVVALVVWDAGEFATTLGAEVGHRAKTRRVELLHALGALSVGLAGAVVATGLLDVISAGSNSSAASELGSASGEFGGLAVALLGAVAGLVVLVMALR